ncbi:CidA/LrgA family protein [Metabacillus lacus]|nr:CidA/LrgA family protein [Metabacillus lacus]
MAKYLKIFLQIMLLAVIYALGSLLQAGLGLPVPGSIIGMVLLFAALVFNVIPQNWIEEGSTFLLKHLTLLFIPATVGLIDYLDLFSGINSITLIIVIFSTALVMTCSAFLCQMLAGFGKEKSEKVNI